MWSEPSSTAVLFVKSLSLASRLKCVLFLFDNGWSFIVTQCEAVARVAITTNPGALVFTDHAPQSKEVAGFDLGFTIFIAKQSKSTVPIEDCWNVIRTTDVIPGNLALSQLLIDFWLHGHLDKSDYPTLLPLTDPSVVVGAQLDEAVYLQGDETPHLHGGASHQSIQ